VKQTRRASFIEITLSVAAGVTVALLLQFAMFPNESPLKNLSATAVFTVASIARGFAMRRVFETLRVRGILS
jgi:hypothetical protein